MHAWLSFVLTYQETSPEIKLIILGLYCWTAHRVILRRRNRQSAPHTVSCLWSSRYELCPGSAASLGWGPKGFHCEDTELPVGVVEQFSERFSVSVIIFLLLFIFYRFLLSDLNTIAWRRKNASEIPVWLSWLNMRFACLFRGFMNIFPKMH